MAFDQSHADAIDEVETLRQELAASEAVCATAMAEVEALTQERDAMRRVVEAAKAFRELWRNDAMGAAEPEKIWDFVLAVDALSTKDGA